MQPSTPSGARPAAEIGVGVRPFGAAGGRAADDLQVTSRALRSMANLLRDAGTPLVGRHVLAMCSGGLDSTVLVAMLARLPRGSRPATVTVAWLDHSLRSGAGVAAERACAHRAALDSGAAFIERSADVASLETAARRVGVQAAARAWRYSVGADLAASVGADVVTTGHTASDQLETVLAGLVADAGDGPIGGMRVVRPLVAPATPDRSLWLVRPLLALDRPAIAAIAAELGLEWAEDPTNVDVSKYRRNRIRHEVVPALLESWPAAGAAIARRSARHADAVATRDALAEALLDAWSQGTPTSPLRLDRLEALPDHARAQVVAAWLRRSWSEEGGACGARAVTSRLIASVVHLATSGPARAGRSGRSIDLPHGARVRRAGYSLVIDYPPSSPAQMPGGSA